MASGDHTDGTEGTSLSSQNVLVGSAVLKSCSPWHHAPRGQLARLSLSTAAEGQCVRDTVPSSSRGESCSCLHLTLGPVLGFSSKVCQGLVSPTVPWTPRENEWVVIFSAFPNSRLAVAADADLCRREPAVSATPRPLGALDTWAGTLLAFSESSGIASLTCSEHTVPSDTMRAS